MSRYAAQTEVSESKSRQEIEKTVTRYGADQFGYSITVEDGDRRHTVLTNDGTVPASLRPLLDWLNRAARQ